MIRLVAIATLTMLLLGSWSTSDRMAETCITLLDQANSKKIETNELCQVIQEQRTLLYIAYPEAVLDWTKDVNELCK